MDKKLEKVISINSDMHGQLANHDYHNKQNICMAHLIMALSTIVEGTRFESDIKVMIETSEKFYNR